MCVFICLMVIIIVIGEFNYQAVSLNQYCEWNQGFREICRSIFKCNKNCWTEYLLSQLYLCAYYSGEYKPWLLYYSTVFVLRFHLSVDTVTNFFRLSTPGTFVAANCSCIQEILIFRLMIMLSLFCQKLIPSCPLFLQLTVFVCSQRN